MHKLNSIYISLKKKCHGRVYFCMELPKTIIQKHNLALNSGPLNEKCSESILCGVLKIPAIHKHFLKPTDLLQPNTDETRHLWISFIWETLISDTNTLH